MSSENEQPPRRTVGRHAAPRDTVRGRISRPVGRAIALTAMPTALLMGTLAPKLAFAADAKAKVVPNSVPDKAGPSGAACTKGAPGTGTGATTGTPTTGAKGTSGTKATTGKPAAGSGAAHGTTTTTKPSASVPQQRSTPPATTTGSGSSSGSGSTAGTPAPAPTPTKSAPAKTAPTDPVTTILNGLGGILGLTSQPVTTAKAAAAAPAPSASPSASTTSTAAPRTAAHRAAAATTPSAQPTATPSKAATTPTAGPTPSASSPAAPTTGKPSGTGPGSTGTTAGGTAATNTDPSKLCDISHLAAPLDTSITSQLPGGTMPIEPWTLKSSDLKLINTEFHGVVTIQLADGSTERVLKFTAEEVNIGNLDMSANQRGQEIHVKGGPGTTSTMRGGTVTMYVKELKGTLLAAEGIPLGLLNVSLDLTPDTLPQWLYNLIGAIPIPLTLELGDMTAVQAGQFGGNLTIPGMHLYYTPLGQ